MYKMTYSMDETQAMYAAVSEDMLRWTPFKEGEPVLDLRPAGRIIRDPFWFEFEGRYHALFTDNWQSRTIGHAVSDNFVDWEIADFIPVMGENEDVANCWAPEVYFEPDGTGVILWSTSFISRNNEHKISNRIWALKTKDFREFSKPELFFDPGYPVIDATMWREDGTYYMAFKDERGFNAPGSPYSAIRTTWGREEEKPFSWGKEPVCRMDGPMGRNISPLLTGWRTEGPILIKKDGEFYLFYDSFGDHTYKGLRSRDYREWTDISGEMDFPFHCKHLCIRKDTLNP
ncbi:MAG TPA: family 43 glycosylhydrolase [Candidatus Caccomorpha excrementavium]|nr:family 43 glycosylhydrolase [Candidatus Caccomorpha excrementavium]